MQAKFGQRLGYYQLLANYMPGRKSRLSVNQLVGGQGRMAGDLEFELIEEFWTFAQIVGQKCLGADKNALLLLYENHAVKQMWARS